VEQPDAERRTSPHEANLLRLDCTKAAVHLGWTGVYTAREAVEKTVLWYKKHVQDPVF